MSQRLFAVAFRALQESTKTIHFSVEIYTGRSVPDTIRICLDSFKKTLSAADGWSHWEVLAKQMDPAWIATVMREAEWFDQSFSRHLYAIGVYAVHEAESKAAILVGSALTYNDRCAQDKLDEFAQQHCPASEGWSIMTTDLMEWDEYPRRYPTRQTHWVPPGTTTH